MQGKRTHQFVLDNVHADGPVGNEHNSFAERCNVAMKEDKPSVQDLLIFIYTGGGRSLEWEPRDWNTVLQVTLTVAEDSPVLVEALREWRENQTRCGHIGLA